MYIPLLFINFQESKVDEDIRPLVIMMAMIGLKCHLKRMLRQSFTMCRRILALNLKRRKVNSKVNVRVRKWIEGLGRLGKEEENYFSNWEHSGISVLLNPLSRGYSLHSTGYTGSLKWLLFKSWISFTLNSLQWLHIPAFEVLKQNIKQGVSCRKLKCRPLTSLWWLFRGKSS